MMSEQKKVEEFPVDPETDAIYASAEQFFASIKEGAVKKEADQETLDYIDQQAAEVARYRKEDAMLTQLHEEGQEALDQDGPDLDPEIDGLEQTFVGWVVELRDRRRREALGFARMLAHAGGEGGECGGCEGCG